MNKNITTTIIKELLKSGFSPNKISQVVNINEKSQIRKCLCTQIVSQGNCTLKDIVKQVRLNGF